MLSFLKLQSIIGCFLLILLANISNASDKNHEECASPSFWSKGDCWIILNEENEDCMVEPIIMQLEDQPVYCPKKQIKMFKKEVDYKKKLKKLKTKNIAEEIEGVIAMGSYYLLGFNAGTVTILPGLNQNQQENNQCKIVYLDDMNLALTEENYRKYQHALTDYASQFNKNLITFCQ